MSRRSVWLALSAAALLSVAAPARATVCALDDAPAATLLLPYFEVDLASPSGRTTLMAIGNAAAAPALAHVVLWTDMAVPTLAFDVYLTGWDVETVNLRDLFAGVLPRTADLARDPDDGVSPRGRLSQDASFPGCEGLLPPPPPGAAFVEHLRRVHQGLSSPLLGGRCAALPIRDGIARGFATVDVASRCSPLVPGDAGYFGPGGVAGSANVLWGDFFAVDPSGNLAEGERLVRIEADPERFPPGSRTFYSAWTGSAGADGREPIGARWAARFLEGGAFRSGTHFVVWRDPMARGAAFLCGRVPPGYPLDSERVLHFDEQESAEELSCAFFPIPIPCPVPFAVAAQQVRVGRGEVPTSFEFGWSELDLDPGPPGFGPRGQAWVGTTVTAHGRYGVGYEATALEDGCDRCAQGTEAEPGRLCVRGPLETGQPVAIEVMPKGCFSSSCTQRFSADCGVTRRDGILALTTRICLGTALGGACTPDCSGGGIARCSSEGLPAGSYEARAGALRVAFTVPGTVPPEGLCAGSPF